MSDEVVTALAEKAVSVDAWFALPKHRPRKEGDDIFILEFHVSGEDWWEHFQSYPRNTHVKLTLWQVEDEEDARYEAMKDKPKGPYGAIWRELFASGFQHCPEVRERLTAESNGMLGDEKATDKFALRRVFEVESLTLVSPEKVREVFMSDAAQRMIEQAERKVVEKAAA